MSPARARAAPPAEEIDRAAFEPAYNQLANILRRQIARGVYRPGDRLPSEAELRSQYQVSSITVRRAIQILVEEELAESRQGYGTYLRPIRLGDATFGLERLREIFADPRTTVRILGANAVRADKRVARKLQIERGARVIYIHRLLLQDERPLIYQREYMRLDLSSPIVEAELEVTSLGGLFSGQGETLLKRGDLSIDATALNEIEAPLLERALGEPAFAIQHVFYDFQDQVVSWGWFICPGDLMRFQTRVGAPPTPREGETNG